MTDEVVEPIEVGNGPADIAVGEGAVWVTNRFDGTISRIDPDSGEVVENPGRARSRAGSRLGSAAYGWRWPGRTTVVRIDPETNTVTHRSAWGTGRGRWP